MEIGKSVRVSVNNSVWRSVENPIRGSVFHSIGYPLYDFVTMTSVSASVRVSVWGSVCNSVYIKKHNKFA